MNSPLVKNASISVCIKAMWRHWVYPVGAISAVFLLAVYFDKYVVTLATLGLAPLLLRIRAHYRSTIDTSMCLTTTTQVALSLVLSSAVMILTMWLLRDYHGSELNGQPYNPDIPFVTTMLVSGMTALVTGVVWMLHLNRRRMRRYMSSAGGRTAITLFRAKLLNREAIFHTKLLCIMSLVITIIGTVYYFMHYINTNLSLRDKVIYAWVPAVIYTVSLVYHAIRYYSFYAYYCHNEYLEMIDRGGRTSVRYLLLHDDMIFLIPRTLDSLVRWDTPANYTLPFRHNFSLYDAINHLREHTELRDGASVEPAFDTYDSTAQHNAFHYFVFISDAAAVSGLYPDGRWYTLGMIQQMYADGRLSNELASEINRIHTIAMAYKTYDREGRRLYKIKNYRPTFRLKDLPKWDVDYNDETWLRVSRDNQDRPLYGLRRVLRKIRSVITEDGGDDTQGQR